MTISLIATVGDDAARLDAFLDSVAAQTRRPDEVIVLLTGRAAGAESIVRVHPLGAVFASLQALAPESLAALAHGDAVAVADASAVLAADFIARAGALSGRDAAVFPCEPMAETLEEACRASVSPAAGGRFLALGRQAWEIAAARPGFLALDAAHAVSALEDAGLAPHAHSAAAARVRLAPDARALYHEGRRATEADGRALANTKSHLLRLGLYAAGLEMLLMGFWRAVWVLPVLAAYALYMAGPVKAYMAGGRSLCPKAAALMTWMRLSQDAGRIVGYLSGLKSAHELPEEAPKQ
ncbi:hypothetical protein NNJEOMEG_00264 [Fundidesulfovibrio magnetotacticus]|uniref:Glycosyltransferase n=1 Tax=Fundidesulfovibrio magnetotacticus TaxID=2730080 RepID=A0A6V8LQM6_9BACT|nr:hypothetical protein [Fundidesulfovibrio magnetotacticus]GFK92439.1 hypothetical protein NNJEOMEG_00264 [Fundidesulfovibrio magnetotacticus]